MLAFSACLESGPRVDLPSPVWQPLSVTIPSQHHWSKTMPKKPKITSRQVRSISKRLAQKYTVEEIVKAVKVSKTTVERVRADYNAITYQSALNRVERG